MNSLFFLPFQCWVSNTPLPFLYKEEGKTIKKNVESAAPPSPPDGIHCRNWGGRSERKRKKEDIITDALWPEHVHRLCRHIHMQPRPAMPTNWKRVSIAYKLFLKVVAKKKETLFWTDFKSKSQHGCSATSRHGFRDHATRMALYSTRVVALLFLFSRSFICSCWFPVWMPHYFGTRSTMQGYGVGPSWCLTARRRSPIRRRRWDAGPLDKRGWNLLIHIRKHQPHHAYIWHDPVFRYRRNRHGDVWHLGVSMFNGSVWTLRSRPLGDGMNPKTHAGWTSPRTRQPDVISAARNAGKKKWLILFLTLSFPLEYLRYLEPPPPLQLPLTPCIPSIAAAPPL